MLRRTFAILVSGLLLGSTLGFQSVSAQSGSNSDSAEKARAAVQKLGRDAKVEVKMRDNSKLKGYISAMDQDSFVVTDPKTGSSQTVTYGEALQVKKPSGGVSRGWIIGGAAAAAAVIVGAIVLKPVLCDGGAQSRGPC